MLTNYYYYYPGALSDKDCDRIIELGDKKINDKLSKGESVDGTTGDNNQKFKDSLKKSMRDKTKHEIAQSGDSLDNYYARDSQITWLNDDWLYNLITPYFKNANKNSGWNFDYDTFEECQYTTYNAPGGYYTWHKDSAMDIQSVWQRYIAGITPIDKNGQPSYPFTKQNHIIGKIRKLSMTINISDNNDYEGGDFKFDYSEHNDTRFDTVKQIKKRGSIIVFPSFVPHMVSPVTKGTRRSLVAWANGRPFR
tara:strand:+ start:46 stop:798 length:753 start_codon:yes stop_codon:yes gene_type:complete